VAVGDALSPLAVGIDLVDVPRIRTMHGRFGDRLLRRLLTPDERVYCLGKAVPEEHVAVRVAAKEATYKALRHVGGGTDVGWLEIEVTSGDDGVPSLQLHGRAEQAATRAGVRQVLVSLTHTAATAAVVVVLAG
jgi:holo-[acyl-carrier protein] synthase